jgi:hypothetical protein
VPRRPRLRVAGMVNGRKNRFAAAGRPFTVVRVHHGEPVAMASYKESLDRIRKRQRRDREENERLTATMVGGGLGLGGIAGFEALVKQTPRAASVDANGAIPTQLVIAGVLLGGGLMSRGATADGFFSAGWAFAGVAAQKMSARMMEPV